MALGRGQFGECFYYNLKGGVPVGFFEASASFLFLLNVAVRAFMFQFSALQFPSSYALFSLRVCGLSFDHGRHISAFLSSPLVDYA